MLTKIATAAVIIIAGATLQARALEGYDGDNNPVTATSSGVSSARNAYAATRSDASVAKGGDSNAVYWRGRYLGTDPDANVRLRILREAIGG
jgi:hypothetical protein